MEETIEEFASDLCEEFNKNERDNYYWLSINSARTIVKGLIAKGYRKQSDTAREILTELKPIILNYLEEYMVNGDEEAQNYFNELCKKYGVDLG